MYVVIYESYDEYNQFEGRWNLQKREFKSLIMAQKFKNSLFGTGRNKPVSDYRNVKILEEIK